MKKVVMDLLKACAVLYAMLIPAMVMHALVVGPPNPTPSAQKAQKQQQQQQQGQQRSKSAIQNIRAREIAPTAIPERKHIAYSDDPRRETTPQPTGPQASHTTILTGAEGRAGVVGPSIAPSDGTNKGIAPAPTAISINGSKSNTFKEVAPAVTPDDSRAGVPKTGVGAPKTSFASREVAPMTNEVVTPGQTVDTPVTVKSTKSNGSSFRSGEVEPTPRPVEATTVKGSRSNGSEREVQPTPTASSARGALTFGRERIRGGVKPTPTTVPARLK